VVKKKKQLLLLSQLLWLLQLKLQHLLLLQLLRHLLLLKLLQLLRHLLPLSQRRSNLFPAKKNHLRVVFFRPAFSAGFDEPASGQGSNARPLGSP
jgi:hypothetical protein